MSGPVRRRPGRHALLRDEHGQSPGTAYILIVSGPVAVNVLTAPDASG